MRKKLIEVGPAPLPAVEVGLGVVELLEAEAAQRGLLRVADAGLDLTLSIGIADTARQGDGAVVGEHVAVERIERRVVDVRGEDALLEIVDLMCPPAICGAAGGAARWSRAVAASDGHITVSTSARG